MAPVKRKESVVSKSREQKSSPKRRRLDTPGKPEQKAQSKTGAQKSSTPHTRAPLQTISQLANDQPAFPRGGADILTPLEKKQIRAQAETDALLETEQTTGQGKPSRPTTPSRRRKKDEIPTGEAAKPSTPLTYQDLSKGMILLGRVTKTSEQHVLVQLSDTIVGAVKLIDLADDYSKANPFAYPKDEVVRVSILDIDIENKKILLSLRPSRVLSFSLPVEDREITAAQQLHINDVVRGFICNVTDIGIFVTLGHGVTAYVRVSNLSDSYLKDWQEQFPRHQLVRGKIISLGSDGERLQMSVKESVMSLDYVLPLALNDLKVGQVVTGKVTKVEDFGVFIVLDNSDNIRGLCHRSELAEVRVLDARKFFNPGDTVKAKVLRLDLETRKLAFGLKASYFTNKTDKGVSVAGDEDDDALSSAGFESEEDSEDGGASVHELDDEDDDEDTESEADVAQQGVKINIPANGDAHSESDSDEIAADSAPADKPSHLAGLQVGGFNWQGLLTPPDAKVTSIDSSIAENPEKAKTKRKHKATIQADLTGELDAHGPQSASDFERLLLSEPDSSFLWLQYMAMHLSLGEISVARHLGQRALQTISPLGQSESEKLNIWIALLNLENSYGDSEAVESTFKSACQVNDPQEVHERLASIYIQSAKYDKADELFQTVVRKFGSKDPKVWINYATFLFDTFDDPERGRGLLSRALQTLPESAHVDITVKFAALEFRSAKSGLPERGRTIFEGLIDSFPKRVDLWNVLLDLEMRQLTVGPDPSQGRSSSSSSKKKNKKATPEQDQDQAKDSTNKDNNVTIQHIRRIFERIFEPTSSTTTKNNNDNSSSNSNSANNNSITNSSTTTTTNTSKLKTKQAHFFFKRWLEFEEKYNGADVRSVDAVKRRAEEWVRSRQAGSGSGSGSGIGTVG